MTRLTLAVAAVTPHATYYVGPLSRDVWSGRLPAPNAVRALKAAGRYRATGATIMLRGATYQLRDTFARTWYGFVATAQQAGIFYVDNVELESLKTR